MKKILRAFIMVLIAVSLLSSFLSCDSHSEEYYEVLEYMRKTPQNDQVAYIENGDIVHLGDYKIELSENVVRVLYVTAEEIFYSAYDRNHDYVYKVDHNGKNKTIVFSHDRDLTINMPDENRIFYRVYKGGCFVKYIKEGKTEKITSEQFDASYCENKYFSVKERDDGVEIKNKKTGAIKLIDGAHKQEILEIDQIKKLSEYEEVEYCAFALMDEKVYVMFFCFDFLVTLRYDFETDSFEFTDWKEVDDFYTTENFSFYVFE